MNPSFPAADVRLTVVRDAARALGLELFVLNASSEHEIETVFATVTERRIGALFVSSDPFLFGRREQLVSLAAHQAIPTLYFSREFAGRRRLDELRCQPFPMHFASAAVIPAEF